MKTTLNWAICFILCYNELDMSEYDDYVRFAKNMLFNNYLHNIDGTKNICAKECVSEAYITHPNKIKKGIVDYILTEKRRAIGLMQLRDNNYYYGFDGICQCCKEQKNLEDFIINKDKVGFVSVSKKCKLCAYKISNARKKLMFETNKVYRDNRRIKARARWIRYKERHSL